MISGQVRALVRAFNRGLTYSGVERGGITNYELPVGPAAGFGLEVVEYVSPDDAPQVKAV